MVPGRSPLGVRLSLALAAVVTPLLAGAHAGAPMLPLVLAGVALATAAGLLAGRSFTRAYEALRTEAWHDPLTGLPNRMLFGDRAEHALVRSRSGRRPDTTVAVLVVGLDDFRGVNDAFGHAGGDALLAAVARRLRTAARDEDTVARLGGDEFAVLLEDVADEAHAVAAARRLLDALAAPVLVEGRPVPIGAGVGVALQTDDAQSACDLLRHADVAMWAAKADGRGTHRVFSDALGRAGAERRELLEELRVALAEDQLGLVYQPVVDLDAGRIVAVEALVRWHHPERGTVPPAAFIPAAEETGLIVPLGRWVLERACRQAVELQGLPGVAKDLTVAVNLSPRQLEDPGLHEDVARCLAQSGLAASSLVLELTESELVADLETVAPALERLKALGVRLALDDVGSGYSRLSYLRSFPVDIIKLDRELIAASDGHDARLTRGLLGLGRELRLATVAEGIERPEQLAELKRLGCKLGQGFLLARPMAAADLADRIGRFELAAV